jgi:integrase
MPKRKRSRDQDGLYRRKDSPWWWASYVDGSGRRTRRSTGTADRKEAETLPAKWKLEAHREKHWGEQPSRTFDELMLAYLDGPGADKRSAERDRHSAKRLYPFFTCRELHTLTASDIRAYIDTRKEDGVGPGTVNREIGLLSAATNYARKEWDWDIPNSAQGRRLREPEGRVRWISREEADSLVAAAANEPQAPHLADFIRLALNTGCRRDELLRLDWRRVDLQAGLIHLEAHHTKSGKRRSVPLNRPARDAI